MMQIVLIALGAAAASALLFASIASGSPLSFILANFAQLPILLAAIGWTHLAGLLAALIAAAALAAVTTGPVALAFLLSIGLPAWWIGYLALLGRPNELQSCRDRVVSGGPHRGVDCDPRGAHRSRHDAALRRRCRSNPGGPATRAGARLALPRRRPGEFAVAAPEHPGSGASARCARPDRAAAEGNRA